ncbi:MAG: hypothetical protein E7322_00085 [Clostridiales bacterium]|nr:hypothetical protein [Clostridiales bacterium]
MKKVFLIFVFMLFLPLARSEETPVFTLDRNFVIPGMAASWNQGYVPTVQDGALAIYLPVRSDTETGRIEATVSVPDASPNPFSGQNLSSSYYKGSDGVWRIALKPKLHKLFVNGDYEINVIVRGQSAETVFPISFKIRNGLKSDDALKPILSGIASDLTVGEEGEIRFTLQNAGRYASFSDISVEITDPTGDILPIPTNVHALSPLTPGESAAFSIPVSVRSSASVSLHALTFLFSYTTLDENHSFQEIVPLPVEDEIRMEIGEIDLAGYVHQGDIASVTVPVMNLGRASLVNASVKLVLPGITDGRTSLIGTIESGKTASGKITFTPPKDIEGEVKGKIEISCEDTWGNQIADTRDISITVQKAKEFVSVNDESEHKAENSSVLSLALACLNLIFLSALFIQSARYKKRIRKLEEDRL